MSFKSLKITPSDEKTVEENPKEDKRVEEKNNKRNEQTNQPTKNDVPFNPYVAYFGDILPTLDRISLTPFS